MKKQYVIALLLPEEQQTTSLEHVMPTKTAVTYDET